ncbi:type IV secretion system protein VirD4 [Roseibaca calidilacus]|uniref:Type IV secretion system protein VirD4 n=2 Tax=Roseibaca calidilacus TaxID=1666912 RepID=A0ABP2BTD4_9RHOB|nr:type IV secretion system protein VirD4 [Roseibaca calidilacus]
MSVRPMRRKTGGSAMIKTRVLAGLGLFAALGLSLAYILATGYLALKLTGSAATLDWGLLVQNWQAIRLHHPDIWQVVWLIFLFATLGTLLLGSFVVHEGLTRFGETHWQTRPELKRNGFFAKPGRGFLLGKMGKPKSSAKFLCSTTFPHCLVVAPTGRGKGTGFVIPNLLCFVGSAVVLDVKGENFDKTSRKRRARGDKVWRFAPVDWDRPTHRYNPLQRIAALPNPDQRQMELRKTANLFLQADGENAKGLLEGGIDLFVACGILAMECNLPTIGEIYRLASSGGDKNKQYAGYAEEVRSPSARLIFERMASTNDRTLTSYLSLLMTSGLSAWDNPTIDRATAVSDFDFSTFRRKPQTVYLVVSPDNIRPLAPLIRLFFSDLIASLQDHEPGEDEPWPVMIMLDEFDRLGKMPIVAESIKTLRSYGGHLAIITQTIPALDEIYGENTRLSLQGGAGVKLYMTPSEKRTVTEVSEGVGMTTKRVVSKSRAMGRGMFDTNLSERTEERPLLTEDEAARLDLDDIILVIDGQHPARAKRIKYYEDAKLRHLFEGQTGDYPLPLGGKLNAQDAAEIDDRMVAIVQRQTEGMIAAQRVGAGAVAAPPPATAPTPRPRRVSGLLMAAKIIDISGFDPAKAPKPIFERAKTATPLLKRRSGRSSQILSKAKLISPTPENCAAVERIADILGGDAGSAAA